MRTGTKVATALSLTLGLAATVSVATATPDRGAPSPFLTQAEADDRYGRQDWVEIDPNAPDPIISASRPATFEHPRGVSFYRVTFSGYDVSRCSVVAGLGLLTVGTGGGDTDRVTLPGSVVADTDPFRNGVIVFTYNASGQFEERGFTLHVLC